MSFCASDTGIKRCEMFLHLLVPSSRVAVVVMLVRWLGVEEERKIDEEIESVERLGVQEERKFDE